MHPCRAAVSALAVAAGVLAVAGCGSDARYSIDQLEQGVAVDIAGTSDAIDAAVVLLPDGLPSYVALQSDLEALGVAVVQPGEAGFDAIVIYRTGPYCGLLPAVAARGDETRLTIEVDSRASGDCDAMEYDEAIGLDLAPEFERATIDATHTE